jgi:voltage-gated potassium channel
VPTDVPVARPVGFWTLIADRFRFPLLLLGAAIAYGTIGYTLMEGWTLLDAVYMTVTTLTTVGFREINPLDATGRIFTITLMLLGVVILFAVIGVAAQVVASGEMGEPLRRRRMQRRIEALRDHYVICAYGRVGRAAAEEFQLQDVPFVVVEPLPELVPLMEEHGFPYLSADPTQEAVLKEAGIDRAKGLVCAVDSDAINVYITLTARVLNPKLSIVSRASSPESVDQLMRAGADRVVSPYILSGKRMAFLALQPSVVEFFDMVTVAPDLRLEEIVVRPQSPLDGSTVGDAYATYGNVTILAVKKMGAELIPSPAHEVRFAAGDLVVALGPVKVLSELAS